MPKGFTLGVRVSRMDRYAAVKLRQRIKGELLRAPNVTHKELFSRFLLRGWLPNKVNNESLGTFGFRGQFRTVKEDIGHVYSEFFLSFLQRAVIGAYGEFHMRGKAPHAYNGMRELVRMTGLQETTIRDILILNGEIE